MPIVAKVATAVGLLAAAYLAATLFVRTSWTPSTQVGWSARASTVAGDGAPGFRDGPAASARFDDPFGVAVDRQGNVFVADAGANDRIRRISPAGIVSTLAGERAGFADGARTAARFRTPSGLAVDADGRIYVADTGNHAIRRITPDGIVTTLAGDGIPGDRDGPAASARFNGPVGVAVDASGTVYVADTYNDRIRTIDPDGRVRTLAGGGEPGFVDGVGPEARFDTPTGIAVTGRGDIFVADTGNDAIRHIAPDGWVSRFGFPAAGHHLTPRHSKPVGIVATHDDFLYVTDRRGYILQLSPDGAIRLLAGAGLGSTNGDGAVARFNNPTAVAVTPEGSVQVADAANYLVRKLVPVDLESSAEPGPSGDGDRVDHRDDAGFDPVEPLPRLTREALDVTALLWPLDPQDQWQELTGTMGEARAASGGDGRGRFHAGVDVGGFYGAVVRAVRDEVVTEPLAVSGVDSMSEAVSVGLLRYVHLRVGRDHRNQPLDPGRFDVRADERGRATRVRVRRGTRFAVGDALGTVNRAYHTHLELGPAGLEINPLTISVVALTDRVAPTIRSDGIRIFDRAGRRFTATRQRRLLVRGAVSIVVDAYDQVDGNASRRRLGLYRLGYQVLGPDGTPVPGYETPRITIEFDRLPNDSAGPHLVYAEGSGITAYGNPVTRFRYIVTNTVRGGRAHPGVWDTNDLPPGDYTLRILAEDFAGNAATARRDLPVTIEAE